MKLISVKDIVFLFAILTFFVIPAEIYANTYYASPTGTGTGTFASPCSFTAGIGHLNNPGDTLYLRGGVYLLTAKISINKTGTAYSRIAIMAYPGETPILDFSGEPYGSTYPGISLNLSSSYMHIRGLIIRYAGDNGMINNGSNHIIENCEFYGNCDTGLQMKDGGGNLILNCDSHDNFDYESGGTLAANFGGNADGFADKQFTNNTPNTYEGCRSWNNADDGWDFFERVGNNYIKHCICYKNGPAFYNMTNHPRYLTDKAWFDQFPKLVTDANGGMETVTLANYLNFGNGNGFKLGGNFTFHNVTLTNCLSVGNRVRGYDQNNNYGVMTLNNESSYENGYNYGFGNNTGGTLIIKNCVSLNSTNSNAFTTLHVTNQNNSWNTPGITCNSADFTTLDTSLVISARNADGSYSTTFMNLVAGSDLIDAGIFASIPYAGNAPDLGYFETGIIDKYPPTLTATPNLTQAVLLGDSIVDIVFTWGGGATGIDTAHLPAGVTAIIDTINKTLTLHGTPAAIGSYQFTVSTICTTDIPLSLSGNIIVTSASTKRIAYFTVLPVSTGDSIILAKLNTNPDFLITLIDATSTTTDYSSFDAIVMSSPPPSASAGFPALETVDKPKLLLKPFALKSTVWNWISSTSAVNTAQTGVTILNKTHTIFSGLNFTGTNNDELQLFSAVNTNGVTGVNNATWLATPSVSVLGNAIGSTTTNSIVEVPVGTNMNGTTTGHRFVMIGLSEFSLANLTTTATQLIENTVYYILGLTIVVPVQFYDFSINDANGSARLLWKTGVETNIKQYVIQRSSNGSEFTTIGIVAANGNGQYNWNDLLVLTGRSFYRIVAIETSGRQLISQVLTFNTRNKKTELLVSPNPVLDKTIHLQLNHLEKGKVSLQLFNSDLQTVFSSSFDNEGDISARTIRIPSSLSAGIYNLKLQLEDGQVFTKPVLVQ